MTRRSLLIATALGSALAATVPAPTHAAPPATPLVAAAPATHDAMALATALLDHLDAGRFAQAEALFSPAMRAAVPADKLQQVWSSLAQSVGPAGPRGEPAVSTQGALTVVAVPLPYAKAKLVARVSVDNLRQVAGFLVQPAPTDIAPPQANAPYVERRFNVGTGDQALPATLAMPKAASLQSPVAAVVLVHGSGPQDRDETIGPNRPFLDIARGLATQGIAVLRYDKRTRVHPEAFAGQDFHVDDEVTRDAVDAVAALRTVEGVDPDRVYVLGHSLGGMLAPRIARQSGQAAGVVLWAAPARPVLDLLIEQTQRMAARDGSVTADEQQALADLRARIERARSPRAVERSGLPMELPARYWRSLESIDPVADAQALAMPILALHGGRDIQVVDADWQRWKDGLSRRSNATVKRYTQLNHLGIAGTGPGTVEEYAAPGHVDDGLIRDIAAWVKAR